TQLYTYADYCKIDDGNRYELINGEIYLMTSPNKNHQRISSNLHIEIGNYLKGKKCEVFHPPFDVILPKEDETKETATITVQPDIFVVCDENKLDDYSCVGAPDLIIEILSPSSVKRDKITKRKLYELNGVREYWIVDPLNQTIDRLYYDETLKEYKKTESFYKDDIISPIIFPDLQINLEEIFPQVIEKK
ncbi:MAG: Uma2 family endonuclease, partial [Sporomusaceae bacterium]|nr:Uma2 family endonuclease [Sporomusaceae bacterium]